MLATFSENVKLRKRTNFKSWANETPVFHSKKKQRKTKIQLILNNL